MGTKINLSIDNHPKVSTEKRPSPCGFVIFGASGDLAHRKLFPAIYDLYCSGHLPENFFVIGFARTDWDDRSFRRGILSSLKNGGKFG